MNICCGNCRYNNDDSPWYENRCTRCVRYDGYEFDHEKWDDKKEED